MALYETTFTYTVIDTPLNEPEIIISSSDLPVDPVMAQLQRRMLFLLAAVLVCVVSFALFIAPRLASGSEAVVSDAANAANAVLAVEPVGETAVIDPAGGVISPVFSNEVRHWEPQIAAWAAEHALDPDIIATIMQIESCGDPQALSHAGAHGLFQVMPFHFAAGEDMFDPQTNAFRGLSFYNEVLVLVSGNVGLGFAGYNGGPRTAMREWSTWPSETQRYYNWGTGIYEDAKAGMMQSPTLEKWMAAGGSSLCRQAATRLGLVSE